MKPETLTAGCVIAAVFAMAAHFGVLGNGIVWDDSVLVLHDERIRSLSYVFGAFRDSFFGPQYHGEMYRPIVNASYALDWFVSGSAPGDVTVWWFHLVNLVLHAANSALAYWFLAEMTGRKLSAPLLAAVLFAVHPLGVEPVSWIAGRCDLLATFFGLAAGIALLRSPRQKLLLAPALVCFLLSLLAKASVATLPLIVALSVMAYRDVPLSRVLGRRLLPRFAAFAVPALAWIAMRVAVLGAAFPQSGGRRWKPTVELGDALLGVGRVFVIYLSTVFLPTRLCGDYLADPSFSPQSAHFGLESGIGLALMVSAVLLGCLFLKRARWAFPVLAFVVALVPVLQLVPIGAIFADRYLYFPALFLFLLIGEGIEYAFRRLYGGGGVFPLTLCLFLTFTIQSHVRARAYADDVAFNRDVLKSYVHPGEQYGRSRRARHRLAIALSNSDAPGDRDEARRLLEDSIARVDRPADELSTLAAMEIEDGDLDGAEIHLASALDLAADDLVRAGAHVNLAVIERRRGNDAAARVHAEEALRLVPGYRPARELLERMDR